MNLTMAQLGATANAETVMDWGETAQILAHSVALGSFLMLAAIVIGWRLAPHVPRERPISIPEIIVDSGNILFLSIGMTGIMILVSHSLARAFAIAAALTLVRFRVKIGKDQQSVALFFGLLSGAACGVQQIPVAWAVAGAYVIMQGLVLGLVKVFDDGTANVGTALSATQLKPELTTAEEIS